MISEHNANNNNNNNISSPSCLRSLQLEVTMRCEMLKRVAWLGSKILSNEQTFTVDKTRHGILIIGHSEDNQSETAMKFNLNDVPNILILEMIF